MIIKGKSRSAPSALAAHLGNAEKNERVALLEVRGTIAQDLRGALIEMDAYGAGTRCELPLYHANIDPAKSYVLTFEQWIEAVDALEKKLGLEGHARIVVLHQKEGREHVHPVWSRINLDKMVSVSDSHNYRKHEEVARDLEQRFGHERVQGAHIERDGVERPDRTPSRAELRQEERTGIKGKQVKEEVTAAYRASDNAEAFRAALEDKGYLLAQGNRRDFVVVDQKGGIHSLARRIDGMKAAELREFMLPIDRTALPSAEEAREAVRGRNDDQLDQRQARDEDDDTLRPNDFTHGMDYVSQTKAALRQHMRRQRKLDEEFGDAGGPAGKRNGEGKSARIRGILDEIAEDDRRLNPRSPDTDDNPLRQSKAPGGGRTRSR
jgi:hypothetical protein